MARELVGIFQQAAGICQPPCVPVKVVDLGLMSGHGLQLIRELYRCHAVSRHTPTLSMLHGEC